MDFNKSSFIDSFNLSGKEIYYYSLPKLKDFGFDISKIPFSVKILLESLIRNMDSENNSKENIKRLADRNPNKNNNDNEIPFNVARILMQDFTGVPAIVDIAAMRDYIKDLGLNPKKIQPEIQVDLIIDHSIQVDSFNTANALEINQEKEIERNRERYKFLKWAGSAFQKLNIYPPSFGICHQINLEHLAKCVILKNEKDKLVAIPDTLVGTDSHTTMINGLGIVGFGVGGIEAESALLGQSIYLNIPKVLGVNLTGKLNAGVTATDLALVLTRLFREKGVVNTFIEFFGTGVNTLSLPERATVSNMCPEYGATIALFPIDEEILRYMELTGRDEEQINLVKKYYTEQGIFDMDYSKVKYDEVMSFSLEDVIPSISGPDQPKKQIPLSKIKENFDNNFILSTENKKNGADLDIERLEWEGISARNDPKKEMTGDMNNIKNSLSNGDVVISAITSCTNTSNPDLMICAGLLAKKAIEHGLNVNTNKVKTSLAPGSRVVSAYLEKSGLLEYLSKLGYKLVGYGCTTCIGNSGPLIGNQSEIINKNNLAVASVLSGNRNYEARIHRDVKANYLMSPPLVVAFGIAGTIRKDLNNEPLAKNSDGKEIYLKDIWPSQREIDEILKLVDAEMFKKEYRDSNSPNKYWSNIETPTGDTYQWETKSTYIKKPPFFNDSNSVITSIKNAAVLAVFGDSLSTDHISPAGAIGLDSPAGKYLIENKVNPDEFNTYGSRRGNHELMMRGTFANNRIKNSLVLERGGFTTHFPDGTKMSIFDAAMLYKKENRPIVVFGGSEYGSGSSRDWAAKGPYLLGVKAIIAKSFERIHRSNLVGMGVLPLQFKNNEDFDKIDYTKPVDIDIPSLSVKGIIRMHYYEINTKDKKDTELIMRLDNEMEIQYYKSGGILNYVLKKIIEKEGK